jgi:hypothetical protein
LANLHLKNATHSYQFVFRYQLKEFRNGVSVIVGVFLRSDSTMEISLVDWHWLVRESGELLLKLEIAFSEFRGFG